MVFLNERQPGNRLLAAVLSLVPGVGLMYVGSVFLGFLVLVATGTFFLLHQKAASELALAMWLIAGAAAVMLAPQRLASRHNPFLALALGVLWDGAGQWYNGSPFIGMGLAAVGFQPWLVVTLILFRHMTLRQLLQDPGPHAPLCAVWISWIIIAVIAHVASLLDAYARAETIAEAMEKEIA